MPDLAFQKHFDLKFALIVHDLVFKNKSIEEVFIWC